MLRQVPTCHEGETVDRAAVLMRQLGVEVVPVLNDNDSVTGLALGNELARAMSRPGGHGVRLREVMKRLGFVICRLSDGLDAIATRLSEQPARYAVVVGEDGRCVGVVDSLEALGI